MMDETLPPVIIIQLGDRVRFDGEAAWWTHNGQDIRPPVGSLGRIVPWNGSKGCAVRFDNFKHPAWLDFPMVLTIPYKSPMPAAFTLIERAHPDAF
jgi:hypothetical protein